MKLRLGNFEETPRFTGDYDQTLADLQDRLAKIQVAHIVHRRRSIILLEGWDAAGKGGIIKRMTADWDPRYYRVWPIGAPTDEEKDHHFLWRFWTRLPASRHIAIFDRSWYGRVLVERIEGFATKKEWKRGYREIRDFEDQLVATGVNLAKLFVHISQAEQDRQLAQRLDTPWKRWKTGTEDYRNRARRDDYVEAIHDMFDETDRKDAPWQVIANDHRKTGRIAALAWIADYLEQRVPMDFPEADPEVVKLARAAFGYTPKAGN